MKTIKFNKGFIPTAIISGVIILAGVVGLFVKESTLVWTSAQV